MGGTDIKANRKGPFSSNLADALSNPSLQVKFEDKINTQEDVSGFEIDADRNKKVREI